MLAIIPPSLLLEQIPDALIANQRRYNLESTNNIVNSSGRRVRGFVGIEALVQPDLTPNGWRA